MQDLQAQALIDEGFGILGMFAEMRAKATLLQNMLRNEKERRETPSDDLQFSIDHFFEQMSIEIPKYESRLDEIIEELARYDIYGFWGMAN